MEGEVLVKGRRRTPSPRASGSLVARFGGAEGDALPVLQVAQRPTCP